MEYMIADCTEFSSGNGENFDNACNYNTGAHFTVDDLLDFSKEDEAMTDGFFAGNSGDSSTVTVVETSNSSVSGGGNGSGSCRSFNESQLSGNELCLPFDDFPELEWLSNFVEESFSTDDLRFIPTTNTSVAKSTAGDASSSDTVINSPATFPTEVSVPGKARSKRSRAAPCDWSSRLLHLSASKSKSAPPKRREPADATGRKCLHCGSEKTPQWRTGPMGPKTLCNACGVRYKSGRLVPEYRPAASPTFVSAKHSNSHRKVLELRRQKDLQQQLMNQASLFNGFIHHTNIINVVPDLGYHYTTSTAMD